MRRVVQIYNGFAMAIGMTSYMAIRGKFKETRLTQTYALVINALTVTLLPMALWEAADFMTLSHWMAPFMWILPYVQYSISYAVVVHTLVSRCYRDAMLIDLELVINQVSREMSRTGRRMNSKLRRLLFLKTFTLTYLCLAYIMALSVWQWDQFSWLYLMKAMLINLSFNILIASTYFYFVSFWQIARGYDFVNQQLEVITSAQWDDLKEQSEQIRSLWALHANLDRTAQRINRHYGPQMLASRFDHFIFSIVNGYMGTLHSRDERTRGIEVIYGALLYFIRSIDFYLNDYICDLVTQYQSQPKSTVSEGPMSKELSSYLIYEHSMRLNLRVCGLYPANRNKWLQMIGSIVCHSVMLMQFHLARSKN